MREGCSATDKTQRIPDRQLLGSCRVGASHERKDVQMRLEMLRQSRKQRALSGRYVSERATESAAASATTRSMYLMHLSRLAGAGVR